ncbi:SpoIIE family protein phosphatase [bacterium]|nr:SpoIIE family protein phosphatase [bacterium]
MIKHTNSLTTYADLPEMILSISKTLSSRVHSKIEIINKYYYCLNKGFGLSGINIYLFDTSSSTIDMSFPENNLWTIPQEEREWLIKRTKDLIVKNNNEPLDHFYIKDRKETFFTNKNTLKKDTQTFNYPCSDGLYIILVSEEETILGIVFINNWKNKQRLDDVPDFKNMINLLRRLTTNIVTALDNFLIHKKIESLLTDQKQLKKRIQKDEEDLKQRILELTVLYETSNSLGYSLDYNQIVNLIVDGLYKVLVFDVCSIFLIDFIPDGEIITRINRPVSQQFLDIIQANTISAIVPFVKKEIEPKKIKTKLETRCITNKPLPEIKSMKSFANVPLIFKEEVIGIINICSSTKNAFQRNEMTFLHTMANQLSSHLGRLKIIKRLEKSKMASLIKSIPDGVIMIDENHQLEIINPAALNLLELNKDQKVSNKLFLSRFKEMGLQSLYEEALNSKTFPIFKETYYKDKVLSSNVNKVVNAENERVGTVFIFRDVTELQKIDRIKTQRLDVISKVNLIIKSISDLDKLLTVLMEFILTIANAEMGSIQLRKGKSYLTKVHSNFPDKIRRDYKFVSGETVSEYVTRTKECCFIENYHENTKFVKNTKITIEGYIGIPIMVKHNLVGIINIVRKNNNPHPKLTPDDIETLTTITSLSGTAIHNALLYKETIKKQKLDQELKVAYDIQTKLLPEKLPIAKNIEFGAISVPAREIGGDYYDFFELKNGNIGIIIADIVGKGIPAGLFMAMLKSILHTNIKTMISPKKAMEKINKILCNDPVIDKFMPVFYGVLNPKTLTFKYCNAGHEPGLIISKNKTISLDTDGFPLGGLKNTEYGENEQKLVNGDFLLLFTDGSIEARNAASSSYGLNRMIQLIRSNLQSTALEIVESIYGDVKKWTRSPQDDITLVGLKIDKHLEKNKEKENPIQTIEKRVSSSKQNIKVIRKEVEKIAKQMGFESSIIFNLKLAVNEAQANVIEHAYFGAENGEILFKFIVYKDRLVVTIKDYGPGMGQKTIKGEKHLEELEGSGLGVFLIKTVMDEVNYNRTARIGTELILTKYLEEKDNGNN